MVQQPGNVVVAGSIRYSVVIPVLNEEDVIGEILSDVRQAMQRLQKSFEILVIDDGSVDRTWDCISSLARTYSEITGIRLTRNFGHQAAICAGLHVAKGQAIGIMDGDGQDPPAMLASLFDAWEAGHVVAYAVRRKRKEGILKRVCYHIFYRILRRLATIPIPLDSGDFSVIDKKVAQFILAINGRNPFLRGLRSWYGGSQIAVEYDRLPRQGGKTKYSWFALFELAFNGITSFSKAPLRLAVYAGSLISFLAFSYAIFIVARRVLFDFPPRTEGWGWSSLISMLSFLQGLNLIVLGLVGEYISQIFDVSKKLPPYIVAESTSREISPDKALRTP